MSAELYPVLTMMFSYGHWQPFCCLFIDWISSPHILRRFLETRSIAKFRFISLRNKLSDGGLIKQFCARSSAACWLHRVDYRTLFINARWSLLLVSVRTTTAFDLLSLFSTVLYCSSSHFSSPVHCVFLRVSTLCLPIHRNLLPSNPKKSLLGNRKIVWKCFTSLKKALKSLDEFRWNSDALSGLDHTQKLLAKQIIRSHLLTQSFPNCILN